MSTKPQVQAVLFDLDGTLADTAPDMADALNILLSKHNRPPVEYELARKHTSRGSAALIQLGFEEFIDDIHREEIRKEYLQTYEKNLCIKTELFNGIMELLDTIEEKGISWGVVTNKPGFLAEPLLKKLGITERTECVVSGDSLANRKPHPDPLHHAAKLLNVNEINTIYIGDDPRDIQAGQSANMHTAIAAYGYIPDNQDIDSWGADLIIQQPLELKDWLFTCS